MSTITQTKTLLCELGDGLALRRSTPADADALAEFNSKMHSDFGPDKPDERVGTWVRDLLSRPHPTFDPGDFTIVEDTRTGQIVSSLNLISQTWSYAGIPFGVGRPEVVGTHADYRKRGLVRQQFAEVHKWSLARGQMVQAITGIPYYYRQFGYEMALDLSGGRVGFEAQLPRLKDVESEAYLIRPAVESDIAFIMQVSAYGSRRSLVICLRDENAWRYELLGMSHKNVNRLEIRIIQTAAGEPVGYLTHPWFNWDTGLVMTSFELKPGVSWLAVTPAVARYLWKTGGEYATSADKPRLAYAFWLGLSHPAYEVFREKLPRLRDTYAFYLRLPDLAGFIRHIRPALEKRLAESELVVGHSGTLSLNFYRSGLKLTFESGRLTSVETFAPVSSQDGDAAFPDLTFLQLLFGYRTFDELQLSFADCWDKADEVRILLNVLFPKQSSLVLPLA
ncbi:MAG: hypothetical protein A2X25_05530 [Chloroflexi bacterium GWB2_49_20]|nr:MAG: hypothetical protein A2X25_05530 [Chloroflexi bacterium GWB2_49_20]OGN77087.1 MAG: hypothetical protein A2X26_06530 [Chloroflexi bacterium GWC2_49_37]OGN83813.1 MAG: hypothetical protein A2X27_02130 [Chloroflexi bacterium GWD2_49_16]